MCNTDVGHGGRGDGGGGGVFYFIFFRILFASFPFFIVLDLHFALFCQLYISQM